MSIQEEIENRINYGLTINRIPKKDRDLFIKLANEEFASDYGMTLKFLLNEVIRKDYYDSRLDDLEIRIKQLEAKLNAPIDDKPKRNRQKEEDE